MSQYIKRVAHPDAMSGWAIFNGGNVDEDLEDNYGDTYNDYDPDEVWGSPTDLESGGTMNNVRIWTCVSDNNIVSILLLNHELTKQIKFRGKQNNAPEEKTVLLSNLPTDILLSLINYRYYLFKSCDW